MNLLSDKKYTFEPQFQKHQLLLLSILLVFGSLCVLALNSAKANQVFLDEGYAGTIFGPGQAIYISGDIDVVTGCRDPNHDDGWPHSIFPIADIWAVPDGIVTSYGSVLSGRNIEVLSMLTGGQFISELLAVTGPGGNIDPGKYDIVIDECQDGIYDPEDYLFGEGAGYAFIVTTDTSSGPAIAYQLILQYKAEAQQQWLVSKMKCAEFQKALNATFVMSLQSVIANCVTYYILLYLDPVLSFVASPAAQCFLSVALSVSDWTNINVAQGLNNMTHCKIADHYRSSFLDPPDYSYEGCPVISMTGINEAADSAGIDNHYPFTISGSSELEPILVQLANIAGEGGVIDSSLTSALEKYQASVNVADGYYQYVQARNVARFANMMVDVFAAEKVLLAQQKIELANLGMTLYYNAERGASVQNRLVANGFTYPEILELKRVGFSDEQIDSLRNGIVNWDLPDSNLTEKELIDDRIVDLDSFIVDLQALADNASAVADSLLPLIQLNHPTANAGGPYSGDEGSPIVFNGGASSDPNGDSLTYDWDFDLDGQFDDASGMVVNWTWNRECKLLIGLKVTDSSGNYDYAWTRVTVLDVNHPPVITVISPRDSVTIGIPPKAPTTFRVTASDPDGDPLTYSWTLDSTVVSTDSLWVWTPDSASAQLHVIRVVVSDGSLLSPDAEERWLVKVNTGPAITSVPILTATQGVMYEYDVQGIDPEGDPLLYSLEVAPDGMTIIDSSGLITWLPISSQIGLNEVRVKVDDYFGKTAVQAFSVNVQGPPKVKDLIVKSVDISGLTTNPHTLEISGTVEVQIQNVGTDSIPNDFSIVVFEDTNMTGSFEPAIDNILGDTVFHGELSAGANASISFNVSDTVLFRGNLVWAMVDASNNVVEDDETNNLGNSGQICTYIPGQLSPVLEWEWTAKQVISPLVVGNLTDDNGDSVIDKNDTPDIVFVGYDDGMVYALDGKTGSLIFSVTGAHGYRGLAVGDIDGDGLVEILASPNGGIRAFENDGKFKWQSAYPPWNSSNYWGGASIADLDHDGVPEIIIGSYVLNNDGSLRWHGTGGIGENRYYPLTCVADLDLDGDPEIVAGNTAYRADGSIYWQNAQEDGFPGIGNFDDDPYPEIVVVSHGTVRLLDHTGHIKWGPVNLPYSGGYNDGSAPTIADFDGDGKPEIGVAGSSFYTVFETDGSIKWASPTQDYSSGSAGSSAFDLDGDGIPEIVYNDEKYLRIYRGTDGQVLFLMENSSGTMLEYPLIVDVDGDNHAEIIFCANVYQYPSNRGIRVLGDQWNNWMNTRRIWNQHTYHITNVNDDGTIPAYEFNNWQIYNNYRQNAQMETNIRYLPDLTASKLIAEEVYGLDSLRISVRAGNGGAFSVDAGVPVSFYKGFPDSGGIIIGTVNTSMNLNPGQYQDVQGVWVTPITDSTVICAVVDDDGTGNGIVLEWNEENNSTFIYAMARPMVHVTSPPSGDAYNFLPLLTINFKDDKGLNRGYYLIDSCTSLWNEFWIHNCTVSDTSIEWTVPSITEGYHNIFFKVTDDAGNNNIDTCSYFWSFTYDTIPPPIPTLILPSDSIVTNDSTPDFTWSSTAGSSGSYTLQYASDSLFADSVTINRLQDTTYHVLQALPDNVYYWHVKAADRANNESGYQSKPFVFTIDTGMPNIPVLLTPVDSSFTCDSTPTFTWTSSRLVFAGGSRIRVGTNKLSSQSTPVTYTLQYSLDSSFIGATTVDGIAGSIYTVPDSVALVDTIFYWRVEAVDLANNYSGYQEHPFHFTVFVAGDVNEDRVMDVGDVVYLINYLFKNGLSPVPIVQVGDINCDGLVDVGDVVYLINYLFKNGPPPCC